MSVFNYVILEAYVTEPLKNVIFKIFQQKDAQL